MEQITRFHEANHEYIITLSNTTPGFWEAMVKTIGGYGIIIYVHRRYRSYERAMQKYRDLVLWNTGKEPVYAR